MKHHGSSLLHSFGHSVIQQTFLVANCVLGNVPGTQDVTVNPQKSFWPNRSIREMTVRRQCDGNVYWECSVFQAAFFISFDTRSDSEVSGAEWGLSGRAGLRSISV